MCYQPNEEIVRLDTLPAETVSVFLKKPSTVSTVASLHTWASPWRGTFGTPTPLKLSRSISLNSGRHSGQETVFRSFPMVFDSWWEISENGDRGFAQNFDARLVSIVVWPGEPFSEKCLF